MRRTLPRLALVVLVLPLLAPSPAAQVSESKALSLARAGLKAALKQEKADLKPIEEALGDGIDALGAAAEAGPLDAAALEAALPALLHGMSDLGAAVGTARFHAGQAAQAALAQLGGPNDLAGQFPASFDFGGAGLADDIVNETRALADKTLASLRKRAAKAAKAAAKAGRGLSFALPGPDFSLQGSVAFSEDATLQLDSGTGRVLFAIGTSDLSQTHDGLLLVGGQLSGTGGVPLLRLLTPVGEEPLQIYANFADAGDPVLHFGGVIDDGGAMLDEGNAILTLYQTQISLNLGPEGGPPSPPPAQPMDQLVVSVP